MAHSTRKKDRAARGGKTKNQFLKAKRIASKSTFDPQARIKELENWQRGLEEQRSVKKVVNSVSVVTKHINMWAATIEKRKNVLSRLLTQLVSKVKPGKRDAADVGEEYSLHLTEQDVTRISAEIKTLKSRI